MKRFQPEKSLLQLGGQSTLKPKGVEGGFFFIT